MVNSVSVMIKWMNICTSLAMQKYSALLGLLRLMTVSCLCKTLSRLAPASLSVYTCCPDPIMLWVGGSGVDSGHERPSGHQATMMEAHIGQIRKQANLTDGAGGRTRKTIKHRPTHRTSPADAAQTAPDDSGEWLRAHAQPCAQPLPHCSGIVVWAAGTLVQHQRDGRSRSATLSPTSLVP